MKTILVLNRDQMGHGDTELGRKILATFLRKSISIQGLNAVAFYNGAVHLLTTGSPVLAELAMLEERGIDLLPCVTCVDHFGIELRVGEPSDMGAIVKAIDEAERVITL